MLKHLAFSQIIMDTYSTESATPGDYLVKPSLQLDMSYQGQSTKLISKREVPREEVKCICSQFKARRLFIMFRIKAVSLFGLAMNLPASL